MRLLGALVLVLLAAAPARADTFGELPFQPVAGVATCLRATGAPGELARWTKDGAELMRAGPAGLAATDAVRLGDADACPEVASQPNGAAVVATSVRDAGRRVVRVAVRDPGGSFGTPVTLTVPVSGAIDLLSLAVAVSPAGDALVAVRRTDLHKRASRLYAFRRPAGGVFLAPQTVIDMREDFLPYGLAAGVDAAGRFTLAWTRSVSPLRTVLETATAPPGGAFGAVARIGPTAELSTPALAVAPDGRALLAYATDAGIAVAERAPGAAAFGERTSIAGPLTPALTPVAAALGADGAAVVAWRNEGGDIPGVQAATRTGPGAFGAPREVVPPRRWPTAGGSGSNAVYLVSSDSPLDPVNLRVALGGERFLLTWTDDTGGSLQVASGALGGGAVSRSSLGSRVRPAASHALVDLGDGRTAIALADDDVEYGRIPIGRGRLQLALPGAARPADAPPPRLAVARLGPQRLYVDDPLVVRVRCSGPCDVRATGGGAGTLTARTRATAGPLTLTLQHPRVHRGRIDVELKAATPGARSTVDRHLRVPATILPSPPVPEPLDVRARRDGADLVVSWRTAFPARRTRFLISAGRKGVLPLASRGLDGRGRRSFRVRLKGAARARSVSVYAYTGSDLEPQYTTVRVR